MNQKFKDVEALIRLFDQSAWDELRVEIEGLSLTLSNDPTAGERSAEARPPVVPTPAAGHAPATPAQRPLRMQHAAPGEAVPDGLVAIRAPNLGTFYRAPKPGAPSYVDVGQTVEADTEVCLIEVMKLFTPVKAGMSGRIVRVCVDDGKMVEYDAPLFYLEPLA